MQKLISTPLLNIAYEENGNESSTPVVLLHGFPDDAKTWNEVSNILLQKGLRTFAPYLRGYGNTKFLSESTMRSCQYTALVTDLVAFTEALGLEKFLLVGHDWGATVAYVMAALYPEKLLGIVTLSVGYNGVEQPDFSIEQVQAFWYQWYFNTKQGYQRLEARRREFCRRLWTVWSPTWAFNSEEFEATAKSWDNPDFIDIVIHSYRHRYKNDITDSQYDKLDEKWKKHPEISVPAIFLQGDSDGASLPKSSLGKEHFFTNHYERRLVRNAGHFIQREQPDTVVKAVEDMIALTKR